MSQSNRWSLRGDPSARARNAGETGAPGNSSAATRAPASSSASTQTGAQLAARAGDDGDLMLEAGNGQVHERASSTSDLLNTSKVRKSSCVSGFERHASNHLVQFVRQDAAGGRASSQCPSPLIARMAARQITRDHETLAHLRDRCPLTLVDLLDAVAKRLVRAVEIAHQLAQADRFERERVVGPLSLRG